VDMQNQTLRELEEFGTDSSKRQAIANAQMEKDGIKIRGLTMALGEWGGGGGGGGGRLFWILLVLTFFSSTLLSSPVLSSPYLPLPPLSSSQKKPKKMLWH
jgi:hypothetical protein